MTRALEILVDYFQGSMPTGSVPPQIIFHGSEPLLRREAVFAVIEAFSPRFRFGIQTNATLLDDTALQFIRDREVSLGISRMHIWPRLTTRPGRPGGKKASLAR